MKKVITGIIVMVAFSGLGYAQQKANPAGKPQKMENASSQDTDKMLQELKLTDEQRTELKAINEDFRKRMVELNQNKSLSVEEMRARRKTLQQERKIKIMEILTPEQKKQFNTTALFYDSQDNDVSMETLKSQLNLTDDQVAKLNEILSSINEKENSIQTSEGLSENERKEHMEALKETRIELLKSVLNADQITKLDIDNDGSWKIKTKEGDTNKKVKVKN